MSEEKQTVSDKAEQGKAAKRAANIAARRERLAGIKERIEKRKAARARTQTLEQNVKVEINE